MSEFLKKSDKVKSLLRGIDADAREFDRASEVSQRKIKNRVTKKISELAIEIDSLGSFLVNSTISSLELEKRRHIIDDLQKEYEKYEHKFSNFQMKKTTETSKSSAFDIQLQVKRDQDKTIDELFESSENLHLFSDNIGEELDVHNRLLEKFDNQIDSSTSRLEKTKEKLESLVQETSNSCLGCVIFGLVIALLLLLIYF